MNRRNACAAFFGIVFLLLFYSLVFRIPASFSASSLVQVPAGPALWIGRTSEVILQGFIILSGVLSILMLLIFKKNEGESS